MKRECGADRACRIPQREASFLISDERKVRDFGDTYTQQARRALWSVILSVYKRDPRTPNLDAPFPRLYRMRYYIPSVLECVVPPSVPSSTKRIALHGLKLPILR